MKGFTMIMQRKTVALLLLLSAATITIQAMNKDEKSNNNSKAEKTDYKAALQEAEQRRLALRAQAMGAPVEAQHAPVKRPTTDTISDDITPPSAKRQKLDHIVADDKKVNVSSPEKYLPGCYLENLERMNKLVCGTKVVLQALDNATNGIPRDILSIVIQYLVGNPVHIRDFDKKVVAVINNSLILVDCQERETAQLLFHYLSHVPCFENKDSQLVITDHDVNGNSILHLCAASQSREIAQGLVMLLKKANIDPNCGGESLKMILRSRDPKRIESFLATYSSSYPLLSFDGHANSRGQAPTNLASTSPQQRDFFLSYKDYTYNPLIDLVNLVIGCQNEMVQKEYYQIIKLLLKHRQNHNQQLINIECKETLGRTPLHLATEHGNTTLTQILLDHGADINATQDDGLVSTYALPEDQLKSIVDKAQKDGFSDSPALLQLIRSRKSFRITPNQTPLQVAISEHNITMVNFLLEHGAKIDMQNIEELSALKSLLDASDKKDPNHK